MAAGLTIRADGTVEMAYIGETPWHQSGNLMQPGDPLPLWKQRSGLDFTIFETPVTFEGRDGLLDLTLRTFGHDPQRMKADEFKDALKKKSVQTVAQMALTGGASGLIGADLQGAHRTAWAFVNAVTQYIDHASGSSKATAGQRIDRALLGEGERIKSRAMRLTLDRLGLADADEGLDEGFDFRSMLAAA